MIKKILNYASDGWTILTRQPFIISSYPKAGSTLCRMMVYNYFRIKNNQPPSVTHQDLNKDMAALGAGNCHKQPYNFLVKSHRPFRHYRQDKVIRLIRNPYDILCSAYEYYNRSTSLDYQNINIFINSSRGISFYDQHLNIFAANKQKKEGLAITYEQLQQDKKQVLIEILSYLGEQPIDTDIVEKVLIVTSRENMTAKEKKSGATQLKDFSKKKDYGKYREELSAKNSKAINLLSAKYQQLLQ